MKFYDREAEIRYLNKIYTLSKQESKMIFLTGRRRVGKTRLILEAFKNRKFLYFFVSKKDESLLCEEFISIISTTLGVNPIGKFDKFSQIFEYIMELSEREQIVLAIDEFQDIFSVNPSIFSDMQKIWDRRKNTSKLFLLLSGSIYSLMKKIFENHKEPLYGRNFGKIILTPIDVKTLKTIYMENSKNFNKKDFFAFYIFTGGIPRYIEIFVESGALEFEKMLDMILSPYSFFIDEGKELLIEEFGKDYRTYFSILSLIASSKTSRSEIESILNKDVGGYLNMLDKEYGLIEKVKPIFSKENSRRVKYRIIDNFLNFWFRFIYKYRSITEINNFNLLKKIVIRDFNTFSGILLEKYFREKLILSKKYTKIGNYWEKGFENEIDIVAINEIEKTILFADVKLKKEKLNLKHLKIKSEKLLKNIKKHKILYKGFSLDDV